METETVDAPRQSEEPASAWEDFIDIFYAPSAVFNRHRHGGFVVALIFYTIVLAVLFYGMQQVLAPAFDAEFSRAMESARAQNPQMTADQVQQMRDMSSIFGLIGVIVAVPIGILLSGLILWGIGRLMGATASVAAAIAVVTFSQFPRILQGAASILQGLILDPFSLDSLSAVSIGPARFVDPSAISPVLLVLLGRLDLFIIWSVVLVAIGIHVVGRLPKPQAWVAAGLLWIIGSIPMLMGAL
ncbi:MAG TPA: YIP1 family protein [Longimicrobiaceae bacterium]|nr:YIP1 family protein [Longimicrobiaceae bacterium]